jgi:tripartite-type tricarboxylate transporter receptor subunit TctC
MFAPAKTPKAIVGKLNTRVTRILADPEIARRLESQGMEPRASTPKALMQLMREDTARWNTSSRRRRSGSIDGCACPKAKSKVRSEKEIC